MQCNDSSSELEKFQVRRLELLDKNKGFIELLQQLTICDSVSDKQFEERFQELSSLGDDHVIGVIEDQSRKIVATGSVFIEKKFIRNCGKVGHIEDVVVNSNTRGMQLGKKIVGFLLDHARSVGCYKVILDCSAENKTFYEKCGFKQKEIQMVRAVSLRGIYGSLPKRVTCIPAAVNGTNMNPYVLHEGGVGLASRQALSGSLVEYEPKQSVSKG